MIDNRAVGKTIATLRQDRNMTQQQLAATLNVSHQAVSKWENGAALPDVQTLLALSRLFGITMEQLLSGEMPENRQPNRSPLEEPIQNIGNFFNSIVNGIFQATNSEEKSATPEAATSNDGTEASEDKAENSNDEVENSNGRTESPIAEESETESPDTEENAQPFDLEKLLQMAPFMSKPAVDALLMEHRNQLTAGDIARFAPFITRECLEKLIQNPETEITWETLQRIAPFLKREMVDRLARLAAQDSRMAKDAASQPCVNAEDLGKAIGDMTQSIGKGVEYAVRKAAKLSEGVANEVGNAINSIIEGACSRDERVKALRRAACERALQDEKWDWLAEHVDDITDEALRQAIAQKANDLGMHEWVLEHLNGYADTRILDAAIEAGNWDWLGDHAWQFDEKDQERIALAAMQAENWQWLSTYAEQISIVNCADQIAIAAYRAGECALATQLCQHCMNNRQQENLANAVVEGEDYDYLDTIAEVLCPAYFGRLCLARAQEGRWDIVGRFAARAEHTSIEQLTELAIAEGNFDAIDMLNPYL